MAQDGILKPTGILQPHSGFGVRPNTGGCRGWSAGGGSAPCQTPRAQLVGGVTGRKKPPSLAETPPLFSWKRYNKVNNPASLE